MNTFYIALNVKQKERKKMEIVTEMRLCAWDGPSVHVLAGGLNGDLLDDGLELGGWDLNLLDLGLESLVGNGGGVRVGVGQGSGVAVVGGNNGGGVSVGVVVGEELGSWDSDLSGLLLDGSWGSLGGSGGSLGGLLLSGGGFSGGSLSLGSWAGLGLLLGGPLGLGAWDGVAESVLAAGCGSLELVGLDLNLVLLGDQLLDDGLVGVDEWVRVGSGESVAGEGVGEGGDDGVGLLLFGFHFLGRGNSQCDNKDQLKRKKKNIL